MARSAHDRGTPSPAIQDRDRLAWARLQRLRHLHPVVHARQTALVAKLRAARARHEEEHRTDNASTFAAIVQPSEEPFDLPPVEDSFADQIRAALPSLRAFAVSLTKNASRAEDLVQDTVLRAWASRSRFQPGTNLAAWLFTILRNSFYSDRRKRRFQVEDPDGSYASRLIALPEQESALDLDDLRHALRLLPPAQREAVLLVGAEGLSYEQVAVICGVAVGTIKSRVNRARVQLAALLHLENRHEFGPDRIMKAALHEPLDLLR